ncbi:MAG: alpha-amylase family glycosyl hydrolase [Caldilineaceae bacterium]
MRSTHLLSPFRLAGRLFPTLRLVLATALLMGLLPQHALFAQESAPTSVSFPGSYASQIGGAEWEPADPTVQASDEDGDGIWTLTVELPGGDYEFKAAINGTWDEAYGVDGTPGGDNATVNVPSAGGLVTFSYDRATNAVRAAVAPLPSEIGDDLPPAVGDGYIGIAGLLHQSRGDAYRTPFGAVPFDTDVTLRFRTFADDAERVDLLLTAISSGAKKTVPLHRVATDADAAPWGYDYWEVTLNSGPTAEIHNYLFQISDGNKTLYYADESRRDGGSGQAFNVQPTSDQGWDIYTYDPAFATPDWAKNALIYQIFPDRFRNGDPTNDPTADDWFYENERGHAFPVTPWNRPVPDPEPNDPAANPDWYMTYSSTFYGGDLQGVAEKLDYLQALGVTTIYFNPIFDSPSNHRYDGRDYRQIAENLAVRGDPAASNAYFDVLAAQVAIRGMHLILDGVPNHVSSDAPIFDRFQRHPELGACESVDSPWRAFFLFRPARPAGSGVCAGDTNYNAWAGFDSLPQLDTARQEVIDNWLAPNDSEQPGIATGYLQLVGVDGWRVDVVPDVVGINPDFFKLWRQATRATNPDAISYAETWKENDARQRLLGDEFDSTMNYRFRQAVLGFLRDSDFQDNDGTIPALTATQFEDALRAIQEDYPYPAWSTAMNLIGSHDVNRATIVLDHAGIDRAAGQPVDGFVDARARLRLAAALQMTLPGAPTIYYGDETGLAGFGSDPQRDDPYNRQPYPWPDAAGYADLPAWAQQQDDLIDLYTFLGQLRGSHSYLRTGSWDTFITDDAGLYVFGRKDASGAAVIAINRSPISQTVGLELAGYLPRSAPLLDAASGQTRTVSLREVVQPMDFRIWHTPDGMDLTTPDAPAIENVEEGDGTVSLTIAVPPLTARVVVRRSLVDGGFRPVGVIEASDRGKTVTFVDGGLTNGQPVYYRAVAFNDVGLGSELSLSVQAIPHAPIADARLVEPTAVEHTISTQNFAGPLMAAVIIEGATGGEEAAPGVLAQAGFVQALPDALPGAEEIRWEEAEYAGPTEDGDLYAAAVLPDAVGDYLFGFRFSVTRGRDWVYAGVNGLEDGPLWAAPGTLTVIPSDDTQAPNRPFRMEEVFASTNQITVGWRASRSADLSHYLLCRRDVTAGEEGCAKKIIVNRDIREYTDTDVLQDHTYAYTAQQVDTSFNASDPSDELEITAALSFVDVTWRVLVPASTPPDTEIFIAGDNAGVFGAAFGADAQPLTKVGDNLWEWTATIKEGTLLQYKYTRGTWDSVEQWGTIRGFNNRTLEVMAGADGTQSVDDTATDWGAEGPDDRRAVQTWRDPLVTDVEGTKDAVTVHFASSVAPLAALSDVIQVANATGQLVLGTVAQSGDASFVFTPTGALAPGTYTVTVFGVTTDVPMAQPYESALKVQ